MIGKSSKQYEKPALLLLSMLMFLVLGYLIAGLTINKIKIEVHSSGDPQKTQNYKMKSYPTQESLYATSQNEPVCAESEEK